MSSDHWNPAAETHEEWRKRRILEGQRARRLSLRRIDYYPSEDAGEVIDRLTGPSADGTYSAVIDRIIVEWACFRNKVEKSAGALGAVAPLEKGGRAQ